MFSSVIVRELCDRNVRGRASPCLLIWLYLEPDSVALSGVHFWRFDKFGNGASAALTNRALQLPVPLARAMEFRSFHYAANCGIAGILVSPARQRIRSPARLTRLCALPD